MHIKRGNNFLFIVANASIKNDKQVSVLFPVGREKKLLAKRKKKCKRIEQYNPFIKMPPK